MFILINLDTVSVHVLAGHNIALGEQAMFQPHVSYRCIGDHSNCCNYYMSVHVIHVTSYTHSLIQN